MLAPRTTFQYTERTADAFQGRCEINSRLLVEVADRSQLVQQLERVPEVFAGGFRVGVSSGVAPALQGAPALGTPTPVYAPPQFKGHGSQHPPPRGDALVRTVSPVGEHTSCGHV